MIEMSELKDGTKGRVHIPESDIQRRVKQVLDALNRGEESYYITSGDSFVYGEKIAEDLITIYVTRIERELSNIWDK